MVGDYAYVGTYYLNNIDLSLLEGEDWDDSGINDTFLCFAFFCWKYLIFFGNVILKFVMV